MNRNFAYVGLGIAIVIVGIALYASTSSMNGANLPAILSVSTSTIEATTSAYVVNASYPVFGISDLDAQVKEVVQAGVSDLEGQAANPSPNDIKNQFVSSFDSVYSDADLVSARLILSQYTGGAHDISVAAGVDYSRDTGSFMTLGDALALTGDSLDQVAALAKSQLTRKYGSVAFPEGLAATSTNYSAFTIDKSDVTFTLQEYQAEPYSDGMPQVVVPRLN